MVKIRTGFIVLISLFCSPVFAQLSHTVGGIVTDSRTGVPIAAVNVRVSGTSRGTITNIKGSYVLTLPAGEYMLIYSYVGYRTDSLLITLSTDISRNIVMEPADIVLPEVVSVAEDPAYAIVRRAISKKHEWAKLLHSYAFKAFTRMTFYRDTSIAGINESYTSGYWKKGDTLREVVTQKRETKNLPGLGMVASVGEIVNFTDDVIPLVGYKFVGPIAEDALDYYDYKLLRTFRRDRSEVYEIQVIPKSRIVPLFAGKISIADSSYAVMGIDLRPNAALNIPFISDLKLNYGQRYSLYANRFWMPTDITLEFGATVGFAGISIPRIVFDQTSVIYDYVINGGIPDSVFAKRTVVVDSSATKYDSTFWREHEVLPLTKVEEKAYNTLDSTQTLEKQFKPTGATASLLGNDGIMSVAKYLDIRFDRVEGLFVGGSYTYRSERKKTTVTLSSEGSTASSTSGGWRLDVAAGYGISDKIFKWRVGAAYPLDARDRYELGAEGFRDISHFPDGGFYPTILTSVFSLFGRNDYRDYYMTYGWRAYIDAKPSERLSISLGYLSERENTAVEHTDFNIISFGHKYRPNPAITDGQMRSVELDLRYGDEKVPLGLVPVDAVELSAEYSSPSILRSDFHFGRYSLTASYFFPTFLRSYLFPPQLQLMLAAGTSTGTLPPQRDFVLDSQLGRFAPFGVLRTAYPREFIGDRFVLLTVEHNFRNVPFLALGVPFLYRSGMEVLVDGAAGQSWLNGVSTTNGWYYEAGFGIGKIFGLIRADLTYRISKPNNLFFSLGISSIL
jgi:Family of unknown function (DUF5686)/CarboxypepD_reg-like domain